MFVITLSRTSLKKLGLGAMCCALVVCSALLGRYISTRTVTAAASVNKIESAQDIQTWFTGYGLEVDGASITADKVKIPRKWDDSFSAFNGVVQQSGMDLTRYKGKTVEKWTALIPAASRGDVSSYGVLLAVSVLCCTPLIEKLWDLLSRHAVTKALTILALLTISMAYVVGSTNSPFLYFNF